MMRTPESKIKAAILHPEEEIRLCAVEYFSDAPCEDETIMPLVIQAVEKYGRETGFRILRDAERLRRRRPRSNGSSASFGGIMTLAT